MLYIYLRDNKPHLLNYICTTYEIGYTKDKFLYSVMDNFGIDLLKFLNNNIINLRKINYLNKIKFILKLLKECCIALKIIHDLGFIHYDVKLKNFLITDLFIDRYNKIEEIEFQIKIIDFGFIARIGDNIIKKELMDI